MADLLRHRVLTAAEERALLELHAQLRAEHGPSDRRTLRVRDQLITCNMKLIARIAKNIPGLPPEDRMGEGVIGLIVAIERFDLSRKLRLSTYAAQWIRHYIQRATQDTEREVRIPVARQEENARAKKAGTSLLDGVALELRGLSLDEPTQLRHDGMETLHSFLPDDRVMPADELAIAKQEAEIAEELLGELEPNEREIVHARYGLDGQEPQTSTEIARGKGPGSRDRVRATELAAIETMRGLVA